MSQASTRDIHERQKEKYMRELQEQIRYKEFLAARRAEEDARMDAKLEQELNRSNHFPWDRGYRGAGGGDPFRDRDGNIITNVRGVLESENEESRANIRHRKGLPSYTGQPANLPNGYTTSYGAEYSTSQGGTPMSSIPNSPHTQGHHHHHPPQQHYRPRTAERRKKQYQKELREQIEENRRRKKEDREELTWWERQELRESEAASR
eukprot:CAMPEP_0197862070 /NCGR_PEP_ID=MMETSP1438-20131217/38539_1 /TAXON_ID=1461541 /ORGANISM="Pterosperma sp., Strain CCMP1384" /LENGTH=206 /DNA_ID=CAMNT_0043479485 /DNA_START=187 /DNA_END=803 /DNA_ORIENTATION=+